MIIDCMSDLHGFLPELEGGDLLIVAGDLTARDTEGQHSQFAYWLEAQPYLKKIVISGNHDGLMQRIGKECAEKMFSDVAYLEDSGCEYEGLKIWGSPWTPTFYNWHFMKDRGKDIREKWDLIPEDTDILITHGPPYGILDKCQISSKANKGKHAGCEDLREVVDRIKPKLHVFGHIHECYGEYYSDDTHFVNASIMNEHYYPVNKPIRIIL